MHLTALALHAIAAPANAHSWAARIDAKDAPAIRKALVVPGSGLVKAQAEAEGLDRIFMQAGMEWREPGCSMCLAMNADRLLPGERCASTSNRSFEGRQGSGGRTHLVSPAMAAAAAVAATAATDAAEADEFSFIFATDGTDWPNVLKKPRRSKTGAPKTFQT